MQTPERSLWEQAPTQTVFGLNYWFDWRTVLKLGYQFSQGAPGHDAHDEPSSSDMFYIHWAMGF